MAPKKDTNKAAEPLTEREKAIMLKAWRHMVESPKLDTNALAAELNYTNVRTLTNALSSIKSKLGLEGSFVASKSGASSSTAAAPEAKKRDTKRKASEIDEDSIEENGSAAKKHKKAAAKSTGKGKRVSFAEEADEFPDVEAEEDDDN
ncbi:hypothetical protein F5Y01DRAFT_315628 [Xylaria sp. FL0043]|nr:hypothetical protein F5Y01DRAFT_315628 [Xylaria sp. FL0043]